MAHDSLAVANYLLDLAKKKKAELSPMKLQKLIYFAHGWHLALADTGLISEEIEAWDYGPVITSVYHKFKKYGRHPITDYGTYLDIADGKVTFEDLMNAKSIRPEMKGDPYAEKLFEKIWEVYGDWTAFQLSNLAHEPGGAWHKTYHELGGKDRRGTNIPADLIKAEFLAKAAQAN